MQITLKDLDNLIKNENLYGCFLFFGKEQYLKHYYIDKIRTAVCPDPGLLPFSQVIIEGGDIDALDSEISSLPMFGANKLIELRDTDFVNISKEKLDSLCDILSNADEMTVLIDCLPDEIPEITSNRVPAVHEALRKVCNCVNFERQSPQRLAAWAEKHFSSYGVNCSREIINDIISFCGSDMFILSAEIRKLAFYVKSIGKSEVKPEMIVSVLNGNNEIGTFDFANAILSGDKKKALALFSEMLKSKEEPDLIMASLSHITAEILNVRILYDAGCGLKQICDITGLKEYPAKLRLQAAIRNGREKIELTAKRCLESDRKVKGSPLDNEMIIDHFIAEG